MSRRSCIFIGSRLLAWGVGLSLAFPLAWADTSSEDDPNIRRLRLDEAVFKALVQNRDLQIERLNPAIAQSWLSASYGYYDPVLEAGVHWEDAKDPGGFDPADLSRDNVYEADSQVAGSQLGGFLPGGLNYSVFGDYSHIEGVRDANNFESYTLKTGIALRQPLLRNFWIDQGRMTIQVNKKNLTITELGVHFVAMDVINRTQQAYYELAYAIGEVRVRKELLETRRQLLTSIRRKIELGTLTVLDEHLAEAQVATVEAGLAAAANAVRLAENELKILIGDKWTNADEARLAPADSLLVIPQEYDLQQSWQQGLSQRPDLAQLREDVAKSAIDLKYRRNQLFPSLDIVASRSLKGSSSQQVLPPLQPVASFSAARDQIDSSDAPRDLVGLVLTVPLGLAAERANFRSSKYTKAQAELRVKQLEERVMREISDAVHSVRSQLERVALVRRARERSEAALEAENQKLAGGKSTIFFVLQLQNDYATAASAELRAKADYNQARSQLRFAEASLLEHWKFAITVK